MTTATTPEDLDHQKEELIRALQALDEPYRSRAISQCLRMIDAVRAGRWRDEHHERLHAGLPGLDTDGCHALMEGLLEEVGA